MSTPIIASTTRSQLRRCRDEQLLRSCLPATLPAGGQGCMHPAAQRRRSRRRQPMMRRAQVAGTGSACELIAATDGAGHPLRRHKCYEGVTFGCDATRTAMWVAPKCTGLFGCGVRRLGTGAQLPGREIDALTRGSSPWPMAATRQLLVRARRHAGCGPLARTAGVASAAAALPVRLEDKLAARRGWASLRAQVTLLAPACGIERDEWMMVDALVQPATSWPSLAPDSAPRRVASRGRPTTQGRSSRSSPTRRWCRRCCATATPTAAPSTCSTASCRWRRGELHARRRQLRLAHGRRRVRRRPRRQEALRDPAPLARAARGAARRAAQCCALRLRRLHAARAERRAARAARLILIEEDAYKRVAARGRGTGLRGVAARRGVAWSCLACGLAWPVVGLSWQPSRQNPNSTPNPPHTPSRAAALRRPPPGAPARVDYAVWHARLRHAGFTRVWYAHDSFSSSAAWAKNLYHSAWARPTTDDGAAASSKPSPRCAAYKQRMGLSDRELKCVE